MEVNSYCQLFTHIFQNILFCILQKKETHTGLEHFVDKSKWWQNVHFWVAFYILGILLTKPVILRFEVHYYN